MEKFKTTHLPVRLSLQYFGDVTYPQRHGDANKTTSPGLSPTMREYYDRNLLKEMKPNLIHDQFCEQKPIPENGGTSIEFRRFDDLETDVEKAVLNEGEIPAGQAMTMSTIKADIAFFGRYIKVTDRFALTAADKVILEAQELCAAQASMISDKITREYMNGGTSVIYAGGKPGRHALTGDDSLHISDIFRAAAVLKGNRAPKFDNSYVAVIHPHVACGLMTEVSEPSWTSINRYGNAEKIFEGELGRIGGVRFVESENAKIYAGGDLGEDSRELTISSYDSGTNTITVSESLVADGRERIVNIGGEVFRGVVESAGTIKLYDMYDPDADVDSYAATLFTSGAKVYPGEGGAEGVSVYSTMVLGKKAMGVTSIGGRGIRSIIHSENEIGGALDQFGTVGWKMEKTAEILNEKYMIRMESTVPGFLYEPAN